MKIAIIGAAGNVASRIVAEALARGHSVTAIGPTPQKLAALGAVEIRPGDITQPDSMAQIIAGHDIVVSAVRFSRYEPEMLLTALRQSAVVRLAVVGGAGSLRSPTGILVSETPTFPEASKPDALAGAKLLAALHQEKVIDWTFLSPSARFRPGERRGHFRLGDDELLVADDGTSSISFEDYAVAFLDEIEAPQHSRRRFTVGY
jgi:uncharacterized protein